MQLQGHADVLLKCHAVCAKAWCAPDCAQVCMHPLSPTHKGRMHLQKLEVAAARRTTPLNLLINRFLRPVLPALQHIAAHTKSRSDVRMHPTPQASLMPSAGLRNRLEWVGAGP